MTRQCAEIILKRNAVKYSCYRTTGLTFTYRFGGYKAKNREAVDTSRMNRT
ncbi:MAG: hypothetical protein ACI3Y0_12855 [Prevotella sp.]